MSFLLDVVLLGLLLFVVALYAKRSIFSALTGASGLAAAAVAAILLTGIAAKPLAQLMTIPLTERAAANELADMYSAPHETTGRQTVAALPLGELLAQRPEAYLQLLSEYNVSPETMETAYAVSPSSETVLITLTEKRAAALAQTMTFLLMTAGFSVLLRLIFHRVEQNFPPSRRYHGLRRLAPAALGVPAGLVVLWTVVTALCWVVPVVQGQVLFLTEDTLAAAEGFSFLRWSNPFLYLSGLY